MKVGKQIKIVSYYPPDTIEQLAKLSEITRIAKAELLREALRDLIEKHAATLRSGGAKAKKRT